MHKLFSLPVVYVLPLLFLLISKDCWNSSFPRKKSHPLFSFSSSPDLCVSFEVPPSKRGSNLLKAFCEHSRMPLSFPGKRNFPISLWCKITGDQAGKFLPIFLLLLPPKIAVCLSKQVPLSPVSQETANKKNLQSR